MALTGLRPARRYTTKVIDYVMNPEKTEVLPEDLKGFHESDAGWNREKRKYVTCLNCSAENAPRQFTETRRLWSRISGKDKTAGRTCYHGYQSFAVGEVSEETAHEIGVKLAKKLWGDRFEVIVATHGNTAHPHNHFVINAVSFADGRKFKGTIDCYTEMRRESDRLCREYGLSVIEEPSASKAKYGEYSAEAGGRTTYRSMIRDDVDRAIRASLTEREFCRYMERTGYELKLRDRRGRRLSSPSLRPPGAQFFYSFQGLGAERYRMEKIRERIAENISHRPPFPEEERKAVREYREKNRPQIRGAGLEALYARYRFELRVLEKYPASVRQVSFFIREDLVRMDRLEKQTQLLSANGIETPEDLVCFRDEKREQLSGLEETRHLLRNEKERAKTAGDGAWIGRVNGRISEINGEMKKIRKELALCEGIEERWKTMELELKRLEEEQRDNTGKEEKRDEHVLERGGGAGRPHDPGRE